MSSRILKPNYTEDEFREAYKDLNEQPRQRLTEDDLSEVKKVIDNMYKKRQRLTKDDLLGALSALTSYQELFATEVATSESELVHTVICDKLKLLPCQVDARKIQKSKVEGVQNWYTLIYDDIILGKMMLQIDFPVVKLVFSV
jgi:hypothetical protein